MGGMDTRQVRAFGHDDVDQLLQLMRGLAAFEGYLDDFRVSAADLIEQGLSSKPAFTAWVCQEAGSDELSGMAVTYTIPWTYDLLPTLVMKELFVKPAYRGAGVGALLIQRVIRQAKDMGAPRIRWTVLHDNAAAAAFYQNMGAQHDQQWHNWGIDLAVVGKTSSV